MKGEYLIWRFCPPDSLSVWVIINWYFKHCCPWWNAILSGFSTWTAQFAISQWSAHAIQSDFRISCDIAYIMMIIYLWHFKLSSLKITNGASIGLKENCVFQVTRQFLIYLPLWRLLRGFPSLAILFPHVFFKWNRNIFLPTTLLNANVT